MSGGRVVKRDSRVIVKEHNLKRKRKKSEIDDFFFCYYYCGMLQISGYQFLAINHNGNPLL